MKISLFYLSLVIITLAFQGCATVDKPHSYQPSEGYVPDAKTACKIAEAVWVPIYGAKEISSEKPFSATLQGNVWTVEGHDNLPPGMFGGTAVIEISKVDGRILRVSHGM